MLQRKSNIRSFGYASSTGVERVEYVRIHFVENGESGVRVHFVKEAL